MSLKYWVAGVAVGPFVLPLIIGPFLPERYECKSVVELECDVQKAWDTIQDPRKCPMSSSGLVHEIENAGDDNDNNNKLQWKEDIGHKEIITVTTSEMIEPKKLVRELKSSKVNLTAQWTYTLEPIEEGKKCRITLNTITDIKSGTWHTPVFRFIHCVTSAGKQGTLDHLNAVATASSAKRKWME